MSVAQLDLSGFADDDPVLGYSATAGALRRLPFVDSLTESGPAGSSARLLAQKYFAENPEAVQDSRLRSGSPADRHRVAVTAALRRGGYLMPEAAALNRLAGRVPMNGNVDVAVAEMGLPKAPVRSRSAENVVARRR